MARTASTASAYASQTQGRRITTRLKRYQTPWPVLGAGSSGTTRAHLMR